MSERCLRYVAVILLVFCMYKPAAAVLTEQEEKERLIKEKIRQNTKDSFVIVHYHLKKSQRPQPPEDEDYYFYGPAGREYLDEILAKQTLDYVGIIISKDGEIFTADNYLLPDVIEKITVSGHDNKTAEAKADRLLEKTCGQIIKLSQPLPSGWKSLQFAEPPKSLDTKTKFYGIQMIIDVTDSVYEQRGYAQTMYSDGNQYFYIQAAETYQSRSNNSEIPDNFCFGFGNPVIICDANSQPLGLTYYGRIDTERNAQIWKGPDILADKGINRQETENKIKERFFPYLYQVKITFRLPPKEEDEYSVGSYGFSYRSYFRDSEAQKEMFIYGLAITPKAIMLPIEMEQTSAEGIDSISVMVDDKYQDARFGGVLKECEATVIEVNEPIFSNVAEINEDVKIERGRPFWTVFARELAGKDLVVDYDRWLWKRREYENKYYEILENTTQKGCWLVDKNGRFVGLYSAMRYPYQRIIPYLKGDSGTLSPYSDMSYRLRRFSSRYYYGGGDNERIYDSAFFASIIKDLPGHYDKFIRRLTRDEQKRRCWLGVEFTSADKETAKHLNLRKDTQDGRIGLIVSRVYSNSPAAKIGLMEGDVLLKIKVPDAPWPIELKQERDNGSDGYGVDEDDIPEEFQRLGYTVPRKCPWPNQDNVLTRMLKVIGEGIAVNLTYIHNGQVVDKEFVIEQSPKDSLSADKYKDEKLGLTVRDATYEVRAALKLSEDANAIVISKVEEGTPAALARINQFELIRAVDDREVGNVTDFESAVKKAIEEKKQSVRLTIEWMGKTRLADLKLDAPSMGWKDMIKSLPNIEGNKTGDN